MGRIILVAAHRLLLAVVILSEHGLILDIVTTYHLLPAIPMTVMGLQVRPIGMSASTGIPRLATIAAIWGFLELWTWSQQNWSLVLH